MPKVIDCWLPALIGAAAAIGGGMMSASSSRSAAEKAYGMSEHQADKARMWEEFMFRNKAQMEVADLKAAGLNPILAVSNGYHSGTIPSAPVGQGFQAGMPSFDLANSAKNVAESVKAESDAKLNAQKAQESIAKAGMLRAQQGLMTTQEKKEWELYNNAMKEFEILDKKVDLLDQDIQLTEKERERVGLVINTLQKQLEKLSKVSNVYKGPAGQFISYLNAILGTINVGGAITGAAVMRR